MAYTKYHPVFLELAGRPVLIVGGGNVGIEKLNSLLPTGAVITVLAPWVMPEVLAWRDEGRLTWIEKKFEPSDVEPYFMVIAATDDPAVNHLVFKTGNDLKRLSNSVDDPVNCNFIMAAMTGHGPMQVAISSAGCSPALAQRVRNRIREEILTEEVGRLAEYLGEWRPRIKVELPNYKAKQGFWERVIDSPIPGLLRQDRALADAAMEAALAWGKRFPDCLACGAKTGKFECVCRPKEGSFGGAVVVDRADDARKSSLHPVLLVGAGPGDPDLITVKGLKALQQAEVVLYDRLANPALLDELPEEAERIFVGKTPGASCPLTQEAIHEILIHHALRGKRVVRLKGGDPFVFGRGGEEALALSAAGVPWEVVPGVSSAIAAPAAAGIPVTHRKVAEGFAVFTGHRADERDDIPWDAAARMPTAVFLMGVERLATIVSKLIEHGRSPETPIALVSKGTRPDQQVFRGTLSTIVDLARDAKSPAAIVVGEVVGLDLHALAAEA